MAKGFCPKQKALKKQRKQQQSKQQVLLKKRNLETIGIEAKVKYIPEIQEYGLSIDGSELPLYLKSLGY